VLLIVCKYNFILIMKSTNLLSFTKCPFFSLSMATISGMKRVSSTAQSMLANSDGSLVLEAAFPFCVGWPSVENPLMFIAC